MTRARDRIPGRPFRHDLFVRSGRSLAFAVLLSSALAMACDDGQDEPDDTAMMADADAMDTETGLACGLETCAPGQLCCDFLCVDSSQDPQNCGSCGVTCAEGQACIDGACTCGSVLCSESESCCASEDASLACVDVETDTGHCGECGNACSPTEQCFGGACVCPGDATLGVCRDEEICCPGTGCVELDANPLHCGACGRACGPGEQCVNGRCVCGETQGTATSSACQPGEACCGDPASCRAGDDPMCACGTVLCGAGQSCCPVELDDGATADVCVSIWRDAGHCGACGEACGPGMQCTASACACQEGLGDCNQDIADGCEVALDRDPEHCGACGNACPAGSLCNGRGQCALSCAPGWIECDGVCVDPATDPKHCGACDNACPSGELCDGSGVCDVTCQPGLAECDGICRDLLRDRQACGTCSTVCGPGRVCNGGGRCSVTCQPGLVDCGGRCMNLLVAPAHCGACGNTCSPGEVCDLGACEVECRAQRTPCGRSCIDTTSNPNHCGGCGNACDAGEACIDGVCGLVCAQGLEACGDRCVDTRIDPRHCGECDRTCGAGNACADGACTGGCPDGWMDCGDGCVDLSSSIGHCGACGVSCPFGTTCTNGRCCAAGYDCSVTFDVAVGTEHACAVLASGQVSCWGSATDGKIGPGVTGITSPPILVEGIDGATKFAVDVAAGAAFTCALLRGGTVECWGDNTYGQLGTSAASTGLTRIPLPGDATRIAAGWGHACAILTTGQVVCWGENSNGQVGGGAAVGNGPAVVGLEGAVAVEVDAGGAHSCIVAHTGEVWCWGSADKIGRDGTEQTPGRVLTDTGVLGDIESLSLGNLHACAIDVSGALWCWGNNHRGAFDPVLSDGTVPPDASVAREIALPGVSGPLTAVAGAQGSFYTCAHNADGETWCWGDNTAGQLGADCDPRVPSGCAEISPPVQVEIESGTSLGALQSLAAGEVVACGLDPAGDVWCWGRNELGQTGVEPALDPHPQRSQIDLGGALAIQTSEYLNCALDGTGEVWCWGTSGSPYWGAGGALPSPIGISDATVLSVGEFAACVVLGSGAVRCWGPNTSGSVGDGTTDGRASPTQVSGLDGTNASAIDVAATRDTACAVLVGGAVQCWGNQHVGTGGSYTGPCAASGSACVPQDVPGLDGVAASAVAVDVGVSGACVILDDGSLRCWGTHPGDGSNSADTPVTPTGLDGTDVQVVDVAVGEHRCAALDDGSVRCWGDNSDSELGLGTDASTKKTPTTVSALDGTAPLVSAVSAGLNHTCALSRSGAVWCWGDNGAGESGAPENVSRRAVPGQAFDLDGATVSATDVDLARLHTCAVLTDGSVTCFGSDSFDNLGSTLDVRRASLVPLPSP